MHRSIELQNRTKQFAIRVVNLCRALHDQRDTRVIRDQVMRSGTSVAANYRAACRSRSQAEFASRIAVVLEEADETAFWLEFLVDAKFISSHKLGPLLQEAGELVRIFAAARHTTEEQIKNQKSKIKNRKPPTDA